MQTSDDMSLVREFAEQQNEAAFEALVTRHVNLVYSAALRQVGDAHTAEEVTQVVFIILARKAGSLRRETFLTGWLFKTTRYAAAAERRARIRRLHRETQAYMDTSQITEDEAWPQIAPLLDEALASLGETDRRALLLRYFERKTLAEVGATLGVNEDAVRKRVDRGLEKLRKLFGKRGLTLTATVIASVVGANSVQAAPVGMSATITATTIKGAAVAASTMTLAQGTIKAMAWLKTKTAIIVGGSAMIVAVAVWQTEFFDIKTADSLNKMPPQVQILPSVYPDSKGWTFPFGSVGSTNLKIAGVSRTAKDLIFWAYPDWPGDRIIFSENLSPHKFDFIANLPTNSTAALRQKIAEQLGLIGKPEMRETNVLLLRVANPNARDLKLHNTSPNTSKSGWSMGKGLFSVNGMTMSNLAGFMEMYLSTPVIDRTGLTGGFDFSLQLNMDQLSMNWDEHKVDDFRPALLNQLGLELVPSREPVEMLIIEKVK